MEKELYDEMLYNLGSLDKELKLKGRRIFLFGHCNATIELIDLLLSKGIKVKAILDNSSEKIGLEYKGVKVIKPDEILTATGFVDSDNSVVLITSRFYHAMYKQLRKIGYKGPVKKLIDYNTYADYSLTEDTVAKMRRREQQGEELLKKLDDKYPGYFKIFCPFNALGDIYFMISYYPAFARMRGINNVVFCVPAKALSDVIDMFDHSYVTEVYGQKDLDSMIQAALYTRDRNSFIAHQDRPYVVNLGKALYVKKIPLEEIYCCGVYGLPKETLPSKPMDNLPTYEGIDDIPKGKAVIFSPYAKSVPVLESQIWESAVNYYKSAGYECFTNVVSDEQPLCGTKAISPGLLEMRSVVERAGTFVGIRSGLCDIIREAKAKKIAIYPDYNYCDTRWKAIDIYYIKKFEHNILATEKIEWEKL